MRILKDSLEVLVEEWSDPGDYPSAAGSGPLPSYKYLAGMEGVLVLELTPEELVVFHLTVRDESFEAWVHEIVDYKLPSGLVSATWELESESVVNGVSTLTLCVTEVEADPDYRMDDEPDEYDY